MSTINHFRHGDVNLHKVETKEEGQIMPHTGSFTLAEGEVTGHHHVISVPNVDDMDIVKTADGGYLVTLRTEAELVHPEHKRLVIPAGIYKMNIEREHDWFSLATRKVRD